MVTLLLLHLPCIDSWHFYTSNFQQSVNNYRGMNNYSWQPNCIGEEERDGDISKFLFFYHTFQFITTSFSPPPPCNIKRESTLPLLIKAPLIMQIERNFWSKWEIEEIDVYFSLAKKSGLVEGIKFKGKIQIIKCNLWSTPWIICLEGLISRRIIHGVDHKLCV